MKSNGDAFCSDNLESGSGSPALRLLYYAKIKVGAPDVVGPLPEGFRANYPIESGVVDGPTLSGELLPLGGEWLTVRTDGVGVADVRATIKTLSGALIYVAYSGVVEMGTEGYSNLLSGKLSGKFPLRIALFFKTGAPEFSWLNRVLGYGVGYVDIDTSTVVYDTFYTPQD